MITPSAAWAKEFARDTDPVFLVKLTSGSDVFRFTSGHCGQFRYSPAIVSTSELSAKLDVITRHQEIGEFSVSIDYDVLKPVLVNHRIKGMKAEVYLGARSLAESDFTAMQYFGGRIEAIEVVDTAQINLVCTDTLAVLARWEIPAGAWLGLHPLEMMLEIIELAGVDTSLIDTSAFAYTVLHPHWNVSRSIGGMLTNDGEYAVITRTKQKSAGEHLDGLSELLNGQLSVDEAGKITFAAFDASATPAHHFTEDEYTDFQQKHIEDWLRNRIIVNFYNRHKTYQIDDTASQTSYAFPGTSERVFTETVETPWLNAVALLAEDITDVAPSFDIYGPGVSMFCGAIVPDTWPAVSQVAGRKITTTNYGYVQIDDEIMKVTSLVISETEYVDMHAWNDANSGTTHAELGYKPIRATLTVVRGQLGTTKATHDAANADTWGSSATSPIVPSLCFDITIVVAMAQELLARFSNGMDTIEFRAISLKHVVLQVGDLITIINPRYVAFGKDGLTSSNKWEIISKEVAAGPGETGVKLTCVSVETTTPTESHVSWSRIMSLGSSRADMMIREAVGQHSVSGGYTLSGSGLVGTLTSGAVSTVHGQAGLPWDVDHTYTASKDTYVYIDTITGCPMYHEVGTGAAQPEVFPGTTPASKVVAGASTLTITDLRVLHPINMNRIATESFDAFKNGTFAIPSATWTKLVFDQIESNHGDRYIANPDYHLIVDEPVTFHIRSSVDITGLSTGKWARLCVYKNGVCWFNGPVVPAGTGGPAVTTVTVDHNMFLAATDYVEIYIYASTGTGVTVAGQQTTFAGNRTM